MLRIACLARYCVNCNNVVMCLFIFWWYYFCVVSRIVYINSSEFYSLCWVLYLSLTICYSFSCLRWKIFYLAFYGYG